MSLFSKIRRKLMKLRLLPIQVYCLHHVCTEFKVDSMYEDDWMQIDAFMEKILAMRKSGVEFISLTEAYNHLKNDKIRNTQYVVLTFDDGYASLNEILPWLEEQKIPATLFINGKYLDGKSYRKNPKEKYLTKDELFALTSSLIEIGSHGWEHIDVTLQSESQFVDSVKQNVQLLSQHPRFIRFHAYTYGRCLNGYNKVLKNNSITPVLVDGEKNYNNTAFIHRELFIA